MNNVSYISNNIQNLSWYFKIKKKMYVFYDFLRNLYEYSAEARLEETAIRNKKGTVIDSKHTTCINKWADRYGRAVYGVCLSVVSVMCCQVEISAMS
jgi:hypothetical protein